VTDQVFVELASRRKNSIKLKCPSCKKSFERRRDSLALGLHWIPCRNFGNCDFASCEILLRSGEKVGRSHRDY
jgi:hypothetical protein